MSEMKDIDFSKIRRADSTHECWTAKKTEIFLIDIEADATEMGVTPDMAAKYGWKALQIISTDEKGSAGVINAMRVMLDCYSEDFRSQFFEECPEKGIAPKPCIYVYGDLNLAVSNLCAFNFIRGKAADLFAGIEEEQFKIAGVKAYAAMIQRVGNVSAPVMAQG